MTLIEVKKALLELLKNVFKEPEYKYYSTAVTENYDRPCFFTQLRPIEVAPANYNTILNRMAFYITFMQKSADEAEGLTVIEKIKQAFGLSVIMGDRAADVTGFEWDYIGTERNIPQITVYLEWLSKLEREENSEVIKNINFSKKVED